MISIKKPSYLSYIIILMCVCQLVIFCRIIVDCQIWMRFKKKGREKKMICHNLYHQQKTFLKQSNKKRKHFYSQDWNLFLNQIWLLLNYRNNLVYRLVNRYRYMFKNRYNIRFRNLNRYRYWIRLGYSYRLWYVDNVRLWNLLIKSMIS